MKTFMSGGLLYIFFISCFLPCQAGTYSYTNEDGTLVFVDDLSKVPAKFRPTNKPMKVQGEIKDKYRIAPPATMTPTDYRNRITDAENIVKKDPQNVYAWTQLGDDYADTGKIKKAIDAYDKALKINPRNSRVLTEHGKMFKKSGSYEKAAANFNMALKIDSHNLSALFNLGLVYMDGLKLP